MGKKKPSRRKATMYDSDDDSESTCTTVSSELAFEQDIDTVYDKESTIEIYLDSLYEKRSSTREAGLKSLVESFSNNYLLDYSESKYETLTRQYLACIKKGSENEIVFACKALGLLSLTLGKGGESEFIFQESSQSLIHLIKHSSNSSSRIAALDSLSILIIHGCCDIDTVKKIMECFLKIGKTEQNDAQNKRNTTSTVVRECALKSWSFLFSTFFQCENDEDTRKSIHRLSSLLNDSDSLIKNAAGQAIALIMEMNSDEFDQNAGVDFDYDDDYDYDYEGEEEEESKGETDDEEDYEFESEGNIMQKMNTLSLSRTKKQSKKGSKMQKQNFREIIHSMKGNSFSESKVKLKGNKNIQIYSWVQNIQINALRRFLGSGFQCHLQENTHVYETFDFELEGGRLPELMSNVEKRLYQSPNSVRSKARSQSRRSSRFISHEANHSFSSYD